MKTVNHGIRSRLTPEAHQPWVVRLLLVLGLGFPLSALAAEIQLREDYPDQYEVVEGDTLWDISGEFLEEPWLWPEIWQDNPQIDNPDLIYPGDVIVLRFVDGSPVLTLQGPENVRNLREVVLSPRVRREPFVSPVSTIPLDAINAFLDKNRIVDSTTLDSSGYFLGTQKGTLLAATGDIIFARGQWSSGISRFEIVREGRIYIDPVTEAEVGVKAELIAEARLVSSEGDQATLRIDKVLQEVRAGDRILARDSAVVDSRYFPRPPDFEVEASILEIGNGLAYGGGNDTLILNVGSNQNLQAGHLLTVQKPDQQVRDDQQGETLVFAGEKFASVLIYRVFENASLGLVLNSNGPIRMNDKLVTP
ncbi:MAG: LysM domain-containing protein [Pseudohongiellaceae bacterium]